MTEHSDPFLLVLARDRHARLLEAAARRALLRDLAASTPPLRVRLGRAVARLGAWAVRHGNAWAEDARRLA